ncbi:MAG: hypothetical protein ACI9ON_001784 [Limisphaerales bacterium]|jgi:hypothetical protein
MATLDALSSSLGHAIASVLFAKLLRYVNAVLGFFQAADNELSALARRK